MATVSYERSFLDMFPGHVVVRNAAGEVVHTIEAFEADAEREVSRIRRAVESGWLKVEGAARSFSDQGAPDPAPVAVPPDTSADQSSDMGAEGSPEPSDSSAASDHTPVENPGPQE